MYNIRNHTQATILQQWVMKKATQAQVYSQIKIRKRLCLFKIQCLGLKKHRFKEYILEKGVDECQGNANQGRNIINGGFDLLLQ